MIHSIVSLETLGISEGKNPTSPDDLIFIYRFDRNYASEKLFFFFYKNKHYAFSIHLIWIWHFFLIFIFFQFLSIDFWNSTIFYLFVFKDYIYFILFLLSYCDFQFVPPSNFASSRDQDEQCNTFKSPTASPSTWNLPLKSE